MQQGSGNPAELWDEAMRAGAFEAAWRVSDAVLAGRDPRTRDDPALPYHERWVWDGTPPDGRDVLVRCYHGLGDTLQFCRYLAPLRSRAAHVTLEVQPALTTLLRGLPGVDRIVPFRTDAPLPPAGVDIEIMELAHALRLPPGPGAYLHAHPMPRRPRGLVVGLCWQAGGWDPGRSVPPEMLHGLRAVPGVSLVGLQRGAASLPGVRHPWGRSLDVHDTARQAMTADLVVTVDTMVAHLAGALGRPCWVLLQKHADWRWLEGRADSPWYGSIRLHRQARAGDWSGPVARVVADLAGLVGNRGGVEGLNVP